MSEIPSNPIVLPQRSRTVSPISLRSTSDSTTVEDEVDILAISGDEVRHRDNGSEVESDHDVTLEQDDEAVALESGSDNEIVEEEEQEAEITIVKAENDEDKIMEEIGDETINTLEDEEVVDSEISTEVKQVIKMFQKVSNSKGDCYNYEEDEELYTIDGFKLPFDNMLAFQSVINSLSLGEKRYVVDYIKTSYETMQLDARRFKGQLRAVNARSGRLRMQIKREENAQKSGIDPDKVPRSSKGIGKNFTVPADAEVGRRLRSPFVPEIFDFSNFY